MPDNFPDVLPSNETWNPVFNTQTFTSPLTRTTQSASLPGDLWSATLTFTNLSKVEALKLRGFLMGLRGQAGTFYLTPLDSLTHESNPSGSPVVNGSSQTGGELLTSGWAANQTVRLAGEYFEVNGELKMITEDAIANALGNCTLKFSPDLHKAPTNGQPIITNAPKCVMQLTNDTQALWQLSQNQAYAVTIECREAI